MKINLLLVLQNVGTDGSKPFLVEQVLAYLLLQLQHH